MTARLHALTMNGFDTDDSIDICEIPGTRDAHNGWIQRGSRIRYEARHTTGYQYAIVVRITNPMMPYDGLRATGDNFLTIRPDAYPHMLYSVRPQDTELVTH